MATASTAYRNSESGNNAKNALPSPFTRVAQVRASRLPERHKTLIVHMLAKNRFGDELWLSTESLQVMIGRICFRRKSGCDTLGRRLGSCEQVSRRTVQKWIDDAAPEDGSGPLRKVIDENSWVGHGKARRFRRSATYELNPAKLVPAKSWDEWHAEKIAAKPAPRRIGPQRSSSPPAQQAATRTPQPPTAASVPVIPVEHRDMGRRFRRLTSREGAKLVQKMVELMRGYTRHRGIDGYAFDLDPGDSRYRAPMSQDHALIAACMQFCIPEESAREALKLAGWKFEERSNDGKT